SIGDKITVTNRVYRRQLLTAVFSCFAEYTEFRCSSWLPESFVPFPHSCSFLSVFLPEIVEEVPVLHLPAPAVPVPAALVLPCFRLPVVSLVPALFQIFLFLPSLYFPGFACYPSCPCFPRLFYPRFVVPVLFLLLSLFLASYN